MSQLFARLTAAAAVCLFLVGGAFAYTLESTEANFTVEMPGEPKLSRMNEKTYNGVPFERLQWLVDQGSRAWIISYNAYPDSFTWTYDIGMRGSLQNTKGTLKNRRSVRVQGVTGEELLIETPDGMMLRQQMFLVGSKLYQSIYAGPKGTENQDDVSAFLNSFHIVR